MASAEHAERNAVILNPCQVEDRQQVNLLHRLQRQRANHDRLERLIREEQEDGQTKAKAQMALSH